MKRLAILTGVAGLFVLLALTGSISAAEDSQPTATMLTPEIQNSIQRGLDFLAKNQNRDGSWGSKANSRNVGITALAGIAFLCQGNLPNRGKYGENVTRCLDFVLRNANERSGYISYGESRMYEHGFATLFLAEVAGMAPNEDLSAKLRGAVRLIVRSQKSDGGWRYDPTPTGESDLSVTVCEIQALRSARNCGFKVPIETINRAIEFVKKSANPDGSFRYMLKAGGYSFALTGAGVTALCGLGDYEAPEVKRGADYLKAAGLHRGNNYFYYGHYYVSQAMFQLGGNYWDDYYPMIANELVRTQQQAGNWDDSTGDVFATAMACIVLQVPYRYLPIFQR